MLDEAQSLCKSAHPAQWRGLRHFQHVELKAHTGFEPVSDAKARGEAEPVERPSLNPFLARVLERVKQSERDRAK